MSSRVVVVLLAAAVLVSGCKSHSHKIGSRAVAHKSPSKIERTSAPVASKAKRAPLGRLFAGLGRGHYADETPFSTPRTRTPSDMRRQGSWVAPVFGNGNSKYLLDTGDVVRIDVFEQSNLSRLYRIDGGGFIAMPLIGSLRARGRSTASIRREIRTRLSRSYLKDPKVTVEISSYRPFFILGEVRNSGQYPYMVGMTVETAVAVAGGYSPRANQRKVLVSRRVDGNLVRTYVPLNYQIKPGDTIKVPERLF